MSALQSRRLRYGVGAIGLVFVLLAALRLVFVVGFSGLAFNTPQLLETLGIGLRFDLRLAVLILLPLALLAWLPRWNLMTQPALRWLARGYLVVALALVASSTSSTSAITPTSAYASTRQCCATCKTRRYLNRWFGKPTRCCG